MKKIVLSLAGVLAATAFAPEAMAVPAFSRQVGMGCTACHAQHFPILNTFGQAFKKGGFTMMGAQGKVEGEHGMSIPDTLNASIVLKMRYQDAGGGAGTAATDAISGISTNSGEWQVMDEFVLLFGGRVAENIGFFFEGNLAGAPLAAGFKMPFMYDVGGAKVGVIPYMTDALGASYGFELASTGAVRNVRWSEARKEISAQQYVNTATAATGFAFVAANDMGYINFSRWSPDFMAGAKGGGTATAPDAAHSGPVQFKSNYLRIAATPTVGDWAMHIGGQVWSGSSYLDAQSVTAIGGYTQVETRATALDLQAHGQVAGKELGVYATWARAPGSATGATPNLFVMGKGSAPSVAGVAAGDTAAALGTAATQDMKAWTIGADYSVIPGTLHIGAAYRNAENGTVPSATTGIGNKDNAVTLTAVYDLTQNVAFHLNHSEYSGSAYNTSITTGAKKNTSLTTLMLEAGW